MDLTSLAESWFNPSMEEVKAIHFEKIIECVKFLQTYLVVLKENVSPHFTFPL